MLKTQLVELMGGRLCRSVVLLWTLLGITAPWSLGSLLVCVTFATPAAQGRTGCVIVCLHSTRYAAATRSFLCISFGAYAAAALGMASSPTMQESFLS